jgi:hypothetical protein
VSLLAGLRLARHRLATSATWFTAGLALVAAAMLGLLEHQARVTGAPDRAVAALFRFVVPIGCFAIVSLAIGPHRLRDSLWSVVRWGPRRAWVAAGVLIGTTAAAALVMVTSVVLCLALAHGAERTLLADLLTSSWVAALAAASYVAIYSAGATLLAAGRGRWLGLVGDFVLGVGQGALAAMWPRSHLANLAGGAPPLELAQHWSSAALAVMAIGFTIVACARSRG